MKTALFCLLVVAASTGCSSAPGGGSALSTPTPTAGTTAATTDNATPTVAASTLSCRLPVISPTTASDPVPGGWITFPGGRFERDPASLPIRLNAHVPSYDRAITGWLPVEYRYVAPSGTSYVLTQDASIPDPSAFYLIDVKTGTRRKVLSGDGPPQAPGSWTVVDFASAGIYLWSAGIQTVPGLWLLDPVMGTVRLVDGSHYWRMVDGGVAWALDPQGPGPGVEQAIYRLDLASGRVERWFQTDGSISMLAPDSNGHVLIDTGDDAASRLALLVGPDQLRVLAVPPNFPKVADGYLRHPGVWLALRGGGLALYTATEGVRVMTRAPDIFDVAGGCW